MIGEITQLHINLATQRAARYLEPQRLIVMPVSAPRAGELATFARRRRSYLSSRKSSSRDRPFYTTGLAGSMSRSLNSSSQIPARHIPSKRSAMASIRTRQSITCSAARSFTACNRCRRFRCGQRFARSRRCASSRRSSLLTRCCEIRSAPGRRRSGCWRCGHIRN